VVELLTDPERCRVALVTLPEEMPVKEAVEAAYKLEDRVGVSLGPLIVNGCIPLVDGLRADPAAAAFEADAEVSDDLVRALSAAADFTNKRQEQQDEQLHRLAEELPLRQVRVPLIPGDVIGPDELGEISEALRAGVEALPS
jgi:anion-transporting  ArsA/GET3 family ATPase